MLLFLLLLLWSGSGGLNAQASFPQGWAVDAYTIRNGLPTNFVKDIYAGTDGKIWLSTDYGLVQLEGATLSVFRETLRGPLVKQVLALPGNRLLVITTRDVLVWDLDTPFSEAERPFEVTGDPGDSTLNAPNWAMLDSRNAVWFAEPGSVVRWNESGLQRFEFPEFTRSKSVYRNYQVLEMRKDLYLISAQPGFFWLFDQQSGLLSPLETRGAPQVLSVDALVRLTSGEVLTGGESGVFSIQLSGRTLVFTPFHPFKQVVTITEEKNGEVWLGSKTRGALRVSKTEKGIAVTDSIPPVNRLKDLTFDRDGNLWIASDDGAFVYYKKLFIGVAFPGDDTHVNDLAVVSPSRFAAVTRNHVFEATLSGGRVSLTNLLQLPERTFTSIHTQGAATAISTLDGGFLQRNSANGAFRPGAFSLENPARNVFYSPDSITWLIPENERVVYSSKNGKTIQKTEISSDPSAQLVRSAFDVRRNELVVVLSGKNVQLLGISHGKTTPVWTIDLEPKDKNAFFAVSDLELSANGALWVATTQGLVLFGTERTKNTAQWISVGDGFPYPLMRDVLIDLEGKIWLAAEHGLFVYFDGALTRFDESHGLLSDMVTSVRGSDRGLVTGHGTGVSILPGRISFTETRIIPRLTLVGTQEVSEKQKEIRIQMNTPVRIAAIAASYPLSQMRIQYRLRGEAWKDSDEEGVFLVTATKSEDVVLEIRAIRSGNEPGAVRTYVVTVEPAWYFTAPAMAVEVFLLLLAVVFGLRYRQILISQRKALRRLQQTREQIQTVVKNSPVVLFAVDEQGFIELLEGKATENMRIKTADWIGKPVAGLFPDLKFLTNITAALDGENRSLVVERNSRAYDVHLIASPGAEGRYKVNGIGVDITEQVMSERHLRMARDEAERAKETAERANLAKSQFLANMSHELRTPLNAIIGYAQVLSQDSGVGARQRQFVKTMHESGYHLLGMINDILDLSKIESGQMELSAQNLSIKKLFYELEDMFRLQAQSHGLLFEIHVSPEVPEFIELDGHKLRQVAINLISNALKYTASGFVRVSVKAPESGKMLLCVEDSGRGIPADQIEDIFRPFRQVQGQFNKGTGLGLTIVKNLVEIMGGNVEVSSEPGKGSRFCLTLPYRAAEEQPGLSDSGPLYEVHDHIKPVVLIVDDVTSNRELLHEMLEPAGFETLLAESGAEALAIFEKRMPDVVLMDLNMPTLNGEEMLEIIRRDISSEIPVIAVTAQGLSEHRDRALAFGFKAFVAKPFLFSDMMRAIHEATGGRFTHIKTSSGAVQEHENLPGDAVLLWFSQLPEPRKKIWLDALELTDMKRLVELVQSPDTPPEILRAVHQKDYRFLFSFDELVR